MALSFPGYFLSNQKRERGFHAACTDLNPTRKWVVYPGDETYPLGSDIQAVPLGALCSELVALGQR